MRKNGFTIAELLISVTIMFVVTAAAIPVLLKKAKQAPDRVEKDKVQICNCINYNDSSKPCEFEFDHSHGEFYTIQLLGGGGGGGTAGGSSGESKVVHYPSLIGKFVIELGEGGGANQDGGMTALYKIDDNGNRKLLEFARGGVTSNALDPENPDTAKGEKPMFHEGDKDAAGNESKCGVGGNAGSSGTMGEVVIRW